jgi:hypothetical protein
MSPKNRTRNIAFLSDSTDWEFRQTKHVRLQNEERDQTVVDHIEDLSTVPAQGQD